LQYLADAGTRWAYHNAPYTLLENVLENATGTSINSYTYNKLMAPTGIAGLWAMIDYDNVFFSRARSMARFGILIQGRGIWNGDTLLHDTSYYHAMLNTSQPLNNSYGYLWWLNGKASYMLPGLQFVFPGSWAPHAPADMFSALGKNGQILSISPSRGIVVVRMGNAPTGPGSEVPYMLCDKIWEKLIAAMCQPSGIAEQSEIQLSIFPQPGKDFISVEVSTPMNFIEIADISGRVVSSEVVQGTKKRLNIAAIATGAYFVRVHLLTGPVISRKILVQK
jgi:CubicO group peptidase (beta-lactamase class C family)